MKYKLLDVTVSKLISYSDFRPTDINLIKFLTDDGFKNQIINIRSIENEDEQKRLKALLPAVTISGKFSARGEIGLIEHSGLIAFDIDKVENMQQTFDMLKKIPYVAYCAVSARGRGYWGIFAISNKMKHKEHFMAMELYFKSLSITIDPAPRNVASLRGYSFDEDAFFNFDTEVFNFLYERPAAFKIPNRLVWKLNAKVNPFEDYNLNGDIESILIAHGWTYLHTKGTRNRYCRPGKKRGVSADYCIERRIFYVFSSDLATGMRQPEKGYNHVAVFCQLECGNDLKLCYKKLINMGYGRNCGC